MKYMTFNSACSYAGVANMLERCGVDMQDRELALALRLPYLFAHEDGVYLAGPMLQSEKWFNLALRPLGFLLQEQLVDREQIPAVLPQHPCAMLGLSVTENSKHAVIYTGRQDGKYCFLNNKWARSDEPEHLALTQEELLARLDEQIMIATLQKAVPAAVDFLPLLTASCCVLQTWKEEARSFCTQKQPAETLRAALNPLFRAILLDGITMLELCGENALADRLRLQQSKLLSALKKGCALKLSDELDLPELLDAVDAYIRLIRSQQ